MRTAPPPLFHVPAEVLWCEGLWFHEGERAVCWQASTRGIENMYRSEQFVGLLSSSHLQLAAWAPRRQSLMLAHMQLMYTWGYLPCRVAQLGFAAGLIGEALTGKGILAQFDLETGLPLYETEPLLLAL